MTPVKPLVAIIICSVLLALRVSGADGRRRETSLCVEDHEKARVGARLWQGIGSSGPEGSAFAGVTERTSSDFDGGWKCFELRLGDGSSLRERYFWMYRPFPRRVSDGTLQVRFDLMRDRAAKSTHCRFSLLGGNKGRGFARFFTVGLSDGKLTVNRKPQAEIEAHVWYRVDLEISGLESGKHLDVRLRLLRKDWKEPKAYRLTVPRHGGALPLRNVKLDRGRKPDAQRISSVYLDNILIQSVTSQSTSDTAGIPAAQDGLADSLPGALAFFPGGRAAVFERCGPAHGNGCRRQFREKQAQRADASRR